MGSEGKAMENRERWWKPGGQGAGSREGSSRGQGMCRGRIYTLSNVMSWRPMDAHVLMRNFLMRTFSTVSHILYREDHPLGPLLWASPSQGGLLVPGSDQGLQRVGVHCPSGDFTLGCWGETLGFCFRVSNLLSKSCFRG